MTKLLSFILSLIALFIALHYYFSFRLFHHIFAPFNINMLGILSMDDLMFSFAYINTKSFGLCILFFSIVTGIVFILSVLVKEIKLFLQKNKTLTMLFGIIVFGMLFAGVDRFYYNTLNEYDKKTKSTSSITIVLSNNKIIKSNSYRKLIWLGSKYAFFFNEKTQHVELYPTGSIVEILYSSSSTSLKK